MDTSLESFHVDGRTCGVIVRRRTARSCRALFAYRDSSGLHVVDSTVEHTGDARDWTCYTRDAGRGELVLTRTADGITADGRPVPAPADTVPAGIGILLLEGMLASCETEAEFHLISEADPARPRAAHYSVENPEPVTLPDGRVERLGVARLLVDGIEAVHTFWFDSEHVVVSDWGIGRSCRVGSVDELVAGLDDELAELTRTFCG